MNVLTTPMKARGQSLLTRQSSVRQGSPACRCLMLPGIHLLDPFSEFYTFSCWFWWWLVFLFIYFLSPVPPPQFLCFYSPYLPGFSLCSLLYSAANPFFVGWVFFLCWFCFVLFLFFSPRSCHCISHSWALSQTAEPENWNEGCKAWLLHSLFH